MSKKFIVVFLFVITMLYFAPVIFSHSTFIARDIYLFYNPKHFFSAESIKQGILPLWNPYLAGGVPLQANVQSCVFYPVSLIFYVLPFQLGYKYFIVIHYFLGSLFMYLLMREWKASAYASLVAGIVFSYGGYLVSILDNVCFLTAAIWLPVILLFHHRALKTGAYFYSCVTAVGVGLQILAGDLSFYVLTTGISLFLYTLFWPFISGVPSLRGSRIKPWCQLLCSLCPGFLLAAVQIIPMLELAMHSTRYQGLTFETATKWSYHPLEFLQLLVPFLFGELVPQTRWFGQLWLDTFYVGIFPLLFAVFFIFYGREKLRYFLMSLLFCGLFLSLGHHNPLLQIIYQWVPGLNMLQYPVKFLFPGSFCLAIMSGMGAGRFFAMVQEGYALRGYVKGMALFVLLLVVALVLGAWLQDRLYNCFLTVYPEVEYFERIQKLSFFTMYKGLSIATILSAAFFILIAATVTRKISPLISKYVVILVILLDLFLVSAPKEPYIAEAAFTAENHTVSFLKQDSSRFRIFSLSYTTHQQSFMHSYLAPFSILYKFFQEELTPNLNVYYHIPASDEYTDMPNNAYFQLLMPVQDFFEKKGPSRNNAQVPINILNLLNIKYVVSTRPLDTPCFKLVLDREVKVYENQGCLPRAFFAEKFLSAESEGKVLENMHHPSFDPARMVYVSKRELEKLRGPGILEPERMAGEAFSGSIAFTDYRPNTVSITTQSNKARFLVLSDTYYPGWRAYVNGQERPVLRVDYTLRGLLLEKGTNRITFVFKPQSFFWGASLSVMTLIGLLAALLMLRPDKKNQPGAPAAAEKFFSTNRANGTHP
jgi:hypothetical protein